ncbi:unnamed protein product [Caenorhabditis sp. 36 PRJEB53466]|nr:unnamed protein product [Caenorhabditis sp. 36 PRJEB53466]
MFVRKMFSIFVMFSVSFAIKCLTNSDCSGMIDHECEVDKQECVWVICHYDKDCGGEDLVCEDGKCWEWNNPDRPSKKSPTKKVHPRNNARQEKKP